MFFDAMPSFKTVSASNAEVTWLSYPFAKVGKRFAMEQPAVHYAEWEDIMTALREGEAPDPEDIVDEIRGRISSEMIVDI